MKQVRLIGLFVLGYYFSAAQNFSPANQFAANSIPESKITATHIASATYHEGTELSDLPAYFFGEKFSGVWVSYYANGNRCDSGYLYNNKPDGLWRSWYPNGQLRMEMQCSAKRLSSAKDEMERLYRPGFSPAPHVKEMKQVVMSSGYPYDKLIYRQLYISIQPPESEEDAKKVQVNIQSNDKADWFLTDLPPFTECMVHGIYKSWFENGMVKDSGYCDNGIREGVWEEWDESMKMRAVGFYKNGLRWKDWRYYNKEGKLQYIKVYNRQEEVVETIALK